MAGYYEGTLDVGCANNGGMGFGGNGWGDLAALIVVAGLFGWGNGGFGGFGGGRGGVGENYVLATDFATIERKLDGVNNGLCDGFYAQNTNMLNGFAAVQSALCQGFNGVERSIADTNSNLANSICTLGYQNQAGFNQISNLIQSCCCDLKTMNLENRYLNEKQTCDILAGQSAQTRAILDYLTGEKISALQAENSGLKAQISNDRQSAYIIDALAPKCPAPAYVVQPPQQVTFPTNCCGNVAYAGYGACGASVQ
jgi:hypothetical protein